VHWVPGLTGDIVNVLNPAAIGALAKGDIENFVIASIPGGIERQEAAGQADLVKSADKLPKRIVTNGITREHLTDAWGITFGDDADDIFVNVTFPAGWSIRPTDHSIHSDLVDAAGVCRAGIFYKAAFYDRKAHLSLKRRYIVQNDYEKPESRVTVIDNKTGSVIHECGTAKYEDFKEGDALDRDGDIWLAANFPDHRNPLAYWDMP
jgi:hypothetical protein